MILLVGCRNEFHHPAACLAHIDLAQQVSRPSGSDPQRSRAALRLPVVHGLPESVVQFGMHDPRQSQIPPEARRIIEKHEKSMREDRAAWHRRMDWDFRIPRRLERLLTWLALAVFAAFNMFLTLGLVAAVWQGAIRELRKSGTGAPVSLSSEPTAFWVEVLLHFLLACVFWWMFRHAWSRTRGMR